MNKRTLELKYEDHTEYWERINAIKAKRLAAEGERILMHPCNLNPYYGLGCFRAIYDPETDGEFDRWLNSYVYYNCTNAETGTYPAYYVERKNA